MKTGDFYKLFAGLALGSILSGQMASNLEAKNLESITKEYTDPIHKNKNKQTDYDPLKSQRGLMAPRLKDTLDNFYVYEFDFNKDLKKAINSAKKPKLYATDSKAQITFNSDTTSAILYYPKNNFNKGGEGKTIGISIRDGSNVGVCDPKGLGHINNHLPSIYWTPTHVSSKNSEKKEDISNNGEQNAPKKVINNFYLENKINVNNFNRNDLKNKRNTIRGGIDLLTKLPQEEIHAGAFIQAPLGKNWFLGLYGRTNLTKKENKLSNDYTYHEKLTNNLNFESSGFEDFNIKEKNSIEGGIIASYVLNKFGLDFSFGVNKRINQINSLKKGYDKVTDNDGKTINEKPFCVENEYTEKNSALVGGISLNYYPTKNLSVGIEGKLGNKSKIFGGIKASIIFGGKSKQ